MKKQTNIGLIIGLAAGAATAIAGALATVKTVKEIKKNLQQIEFVSADEKNSVTVEFGTSEFAKGLSFIRIKAATEDGKDCKFAFITRRSDFLGEWVDEKQFELSAGNGKKKQVCEVSFEGENIVITYFSKKTNTELHISDEEEEGFEALEEPSQETQEELSE